MSDGLKKAIWFVGLWLAGVGAATAVGLSIGLFLN